MPSTTEDKQVERAVGGETALEEGAARRWYKQRRWLWVLIAVFVTSIVAVAALVWSDDGERGVATGPRRSTELSTTTSTSASTSTSTSTTAPATTTTVSSSTTMPVGAVPGVVVVRALPPGGSGERVLEWDAVAGATGYRVLRSDAQDGQFVTVAELDITTGAATAEDEVVNIWSQQHSYVPPRDGFDGPDLSPWFQYVEYGGSGERCFQVIAFNAAGDAPPSEVVCASPSGP